MNGQKRAEVWRGPSTERWLVDILTGPPNRTLRIARRNLPGHIGHEDFPTHAAALAYAIAATHPTPATTGHDTTGEQA